MSFVFWHVDINMQGPFGQFLKKIFMPFCHAIFFFTFWLQITSKKPMGNSLMAKDEGYNKSTK
jgi:hypothetical protein